MLLPNTRIQRFGCVLDYRLKGFDQIFLWPDLLFRMSDAECVIKLRAKFYFAAPPIIIVLTAFRSHKKPAEIDFTLAAHYRHARSIRDAAGTLLIVGEFVPLCHRQFGERNFDLACGARCVFRISADLDRNDILEFLGGGTIKGNLKECRVDGIDRLAVQRDLDSSPEEVTEDAPDTRVKPPLKRGDAAVI